MPSFLSQRFLKQTAAAAAALIAASALWATEASPFPYPASLLDAPATLSDPPGGFLRLGKPLIALDVTTLQDAAAFTGATRLREGRGDFARDYMCLAGTEGGRPLVAWVIASGGERVSEVQLEWRKKEAIPGFCKAMPAARLPFRLGKVGLGMTKAQTAELLGRASLESRDGWSYWFSQRWLRNARNLQELELNWLAVHFSDGVADRAFISLVRNP